MDYTKPFLIRLKKISDIGGDLSFIDSELPFKVSRLYWLYNLQDDLQRGGHAHLNTDRVIICVHKKVKVTLEGLDGVTQQFTLNSPDQALFYPRLHWITMDCDEGAILLAAASTPYTEDLYIRSYDEFITYSVHHEK